MGILSLLLYAAGGLTLALVVKNTFFGSSQPGALVVSVLMVMAAAALQYFRKRPSGDLTEDKRPELSRQALALGSLAWLLPSAFAWLQFELYWNPVTMLPIVTVLGAVGVCVTLARALVKEPRLRGVAMGVSATLLGAPVGVMTFAVPQHHFSEHQSAVRMFVLGEDEFETEYIEPDAIENEQAPMIGEGTLEMIDAFANAEEIDVQEKLDSGEWVMLNGELLKRGRANRLQPAFQEGTLEEIEADAKKKDDAQREQIRQRNLTRRWERTLSGRYFGFDPPEELLLELERATSK